MFNLIPWKKKQESPSRALTADTAEGRLTNLRDEFDGLFNRFLDSFPAVDDRWFRGPLGWSFDVDETDKAYTIRAEAAGFEADDFDVQVRGNYLTISAEHKEEQKSCENGHACSYGRYHRSLPLPHGADRDKIAARYHSGVLELTLPKAPEACGKRITVQSG